MLQQKLEIMNSPEKNKTKIIQNITSYGPLIVTVIILLIQTFNTKLLQSLPLTTSIAILIGGILFLIWHAESIFQEMNQTQTQLKEKINLLETTQTSFINSTTSLSFVKLGSAFAIISKATPRVGHLRIYAISSQQILSFLKFNDIIIDRCDILIRSFPDDEMEENIDFINQIKLVVEDWKRLQINGTISNLSVRNYDFFPTEYECIFDREHLILGLYDSDPIDYSKVRVRDPILVRSSSDSGRVMISEFADRFDKLFEVCDNFHGKNIYNK